MLVLEVICAIEKSAIDACASCRGVLAHCRQSPGGTFCNYRSTSSNGMRRISRVEFSGIGVGLVSLGASPMRFPAQNQMLVVYNPTDSVPRGWYRVGIAGSLHVADIVMTWLPVVVAALAAQPRSLPTAIPLLGALAPWRHKECASTACP